jgi:hypothetical protein
MKHRLSMVGLWTVIAVLLPLSTAQSASVQKMNLTDLISYGDLIVVAKVLAQSDGFDGSNGLPYTEVTISILETLRGNANGVYTFRQYGLLAPRDMGNGTTFVGVSPDGWPKFEVGQEAVLFLYAPTALGFQSTAGLLQGKFDVKNGATSNGIDNLGLFKDVTADESLLSDAEIKMLQKERGPVEKSTLLSFVAKAVQNGWQN